MEKHIVFKLNEQFFGVGVHRVISIEKLYPLTKVPGTAEFIKGIMSLRGEITPVLDLKERLAMRQKPITEDNRILIINLDDIQMGLIVDEATEVIDIDPVSIESPSNMISGVNNTYLKGIAKVDKKLLILLDLEKVTDQKENIQLQEVVNQ